MVPRIVSCLAATLLFVAPAQPLNLKTLTEKFAEFAANTTQMPRKDRIALFRQTFDTLFPGFYEPRGRKDYDAMVGKALDDFPHIQAAYHQVETIFPSALAAAVQKFRVYFPDFDSPEPIWFVHSLGEMDGGTRQIHGHTAIVFGADMIAKYDANRIQPFLDHELLHVENDRYFADCDPLWCSLWKEGLAVYAASKINPGATDQELMLTEPTPMRSALERNWPGVLCLTQAKLDSLASGDNHDFFFLDGKAPEMPVRFGYYVGYQILRHAGSTNTLPSMTRLDQKAAHALLTKTLTEMLLEAHATCSPPPQANTPISASRRLR
jgi:hypothetical protein